MKDNRRIAIVQDLLIQSGGAEEVLREIKLLFPEAPVYTLVYDANFVPEDFRDWDIRPVGWSQRLPRIHRWYKYYMPLYPTMIEQMDLREFDLVISSSYLVAKGILTRSETLHLSYCHTPMRQAWELYFDYKHGYTQSGFFLKRDLFKFFYPIILNYVRMWDKLAADRVDYFACNSHETQKRISKFYRRDSEIIYPPVNLENFTPVESSMQGDFYLCLSRMVPYKRVDLAISAFKRMGKPLYVAGDGPHLTQLMKDAGTNIKFLGRIDTQTKAELLSTCRALVFPGREDFGIVPVEAQASGRPVIAYGVAGARESVIEDKTGVFFMEQTEDSLIEAVERFEKMDFDRGDILQSARRFDRKVFQQKMRAWVDDKWREFEENLRG
jgi:glycosyltransferase involved in cell wall biosynthesis